MHLRVFPRLFFVLTILGWFGFKPLALGQVSYAPYAITNLGGAPGGTFFFNQPYDVAVYNSTNIYIAATYDHTIRKLTQVGGTNWVMSLLAGASGQAGFTNGLGSAARFTYPEGVAVDKDNNVYVADSSNHAIRKITPDGNVITLAELGGDFPVNLAVNSAGTIYVSLSGTNSGVRAISPGGGVGLFLSSAPGTVQWAGGVAIDTNDNIFVADSTRNSVYKVTPGGAATLIAGGESHDAFGTNDGIGTVARFNVLNDVAVSAAGEVFVSDAGNSTLRRIKYDGSNWVVKTIAGTPGKFGSASGVGPAASFRNLAGLDYDNARQVLYAVDIAAGTLRVGVYVGPTNEFNSWTNSETGKWDYGTNYWTSGTPSSQDMVNYITNSGTKAVVIDSTTTPASLNVNNVVIYSSSGDINGLALFNSGTARTLQIQENLAIDSNGTVAITNGAIKVNGTLGVGYQDGGALLNMFSGAKVNAKEGYVGLNDAGGNAVSVSGVGSAWTNVNNFVAGYYSGGNGVLIENGGAIVSATSGGMGQGGNNNNFVVTGAGSVWRTGGSLLIGSDGGAGNALSVVNGGAVYAGSEMRIGDGGDGNVVTIADGGSSLNCAGPLRMIAGVASTYNALYIGTGASVMAGSLTVSNGNFVGLAGGTLQSGGTVINNGVVFPVGVGTESATFRLNGGVHTFVNGLEITDHGVLTGCGTIYGPVTVDVGGTVLPDAGCAIIFADGLTNSGTLQTGTGTNIVFPPFFVNRGSLLTNYVSVQACPVVATGSIVNLADSATYIVTDGTNSVQFEWSVAGPGNSGYVYTTGNTRIALATGVTNITQITNAAAFTYTNSNYLGPINDAEANGGFAPFILLQNKTTGHYGGVRMDDVLVNDKLNATWWFQSQSGSTNFGCVPAPAPAGPLPASNFKMQPGGNVTLSFGTEAGRAYTIQSRSNLTSSVWTSLTNITGDGNSHVISLPRNLPQGYYRVLTQ